jgi:hypothetical protein
MREGAWAMTMGFQPGYPISAMAATLNDRDEITAPLWEIPAAQNPTTHRCAFDPTPMFAGVDPQVTGRKSIAGRSR